MNEIDKELNAELNKVLQKSLDHTLNIPEIIDHTVLIKTRSALLHAAQKFNQIMKECNHR